MRDSANRAMRKLDRERRLKSSKSVKLIPVLQLVESRKGFAHEKTRQMLEDMGYVVVWRRFPPAGGVGSFYWLSRKKIFRVQVFAAVYGQNHRQTPPPPVRKKYLRYAWCIEI